MRRILFAALAALIGASLSLAPAQDPGPRKVECTPNLTDMYQRVKAAYGDFSAIPDARHLELNILFNEFATTYELYRRAEQRRTLIDGVASKASDLSAALSTLDAFDKETAAQQSGRTQSARRPAPMPPPACPCVGELATGMGAVVAANTNELAELQRIASEKLRHACVVQEQVAGEPGPVVLKLQHTSHDEVPPNVEGAVNWTVNDGEIRMWTKGQYEATYSWTAPPQSVTENGFSLLLRVTAKAEKGSSLFAGIVANGGGFTVVETPKLEAFADAKDGATETASFILTLEPPKEMSPGTTVSFKVGAAYGYVITYTYKAE